MGLHIDRMTTEVEVIPETTAPAGGDGADHRWSEHDRLLSRLARLAALRARTAAAGFDD